MRKGRLKQPAQLIERLLHERGTVLGHRQCLVDAMQNGSVVRWQLQLDCRLLDQIRLSLPGPMRPLAGYPLGAGTRCGRIERQQARQELFFVGRAPRSTSR